MILASFFSKLNSVIFFLNNIGLASGVPCIKEEKIGDLNFRGYQISDESEILKIYQNSNKGNGLSLLQRKLFSWIGSRFMIVVEQKELSGQSRIVGMNMYYANKRDLKENTIHEGFIGVVPVLSGRGIATTMRKMAVNHFRLAGFIGISTRITVSNTASLRSAKNIGFESVEQYNDTQIQDDRYYMICKLQKTSE